MGSSDGAKPTTYTVALGDWLKAQVLFQGQSLQGKPKVRPSNSSRFPKEQKTFTAAEAWARLETLMPQVVDTLAPLRKKDIQYWDEAVFKDYAEAKRLIALLSLGYFLEAYGKPEFEPVEQTLHGLVSFTGGLYLHSQTKGDRDVKGRRLERQYHKLLELKQQFDCHRIVPQGFPVVLQWEFKRIPEALYLSEMAWRDVANDEAVKDKAELDPK